MKKDWLCFWLGIAEIQMITGDKIVIRKAEVKTRILKLNHLSFVEVLRQK